MVNLIVQKKTNFIETKENTQDLRGLKAMEAEVELNSFCFKGLCVFHMVKGKCGQEPLSPFLPPGYWQMLHRLSPLSDLSVLAHFSSSLSSLRKFSAKTIFPASSPITLFLSPLSLFLHLLHLEQRLCFPVHLAILLMRSDRRCD